MNVHYCPTCRRGYWSASNLGDITKMPKHTPTGKVHKGRGAVLLCTGSSARVETVKPPGITRTKERL